MPDANGRLYFSDYVAELQAIGFDGFSPDDLKKYINRAYFAVARKTRWFWERTSDDFTVTAGNTSVDLWPTASGELPYVKSIKAVYTTTSGFRRKLEPLSEKEFLEKWLVKDLTDASERAEPMYYYEWNQKLYVLPPPASDRAFTAYYHRQVALLVADQDQPITPVDSDEIIIDGARKRCHIRSNEVSLAALADAEVQDAFDDMKDLEEERLEEEPQRVEPDDTWL